MARTNKIIQLDYEKKEIDQEIKDEKLRLHEQFVLKYKTLFRFLDIMVVAIVLINLVAVGLTNIMVVKTAVDENKTMVFHEVNPVQQKANSYAPHPETTKLFLALLKQMMLWSIMVFGYIWLRRTIYQEAMFTMIIFLVVFYLIMMGYDAMNDIGYFLGKILYKL